MSRIQGDRCLSLNSIISGNPLPGFDKQLSSDPVGGRTGFVPDPTTWTKQDSLFQCPDIPNGGLSPQSPPPGYFDPGQSAEIPNHVDFQIPRLSYTANAAIMPNNKFLLGFQGTTLRPFRYVTMGQVSHPSNTILLTEWLNDPSVVTDKGRLNPAVNTCKSNRPTNGFVVLTNGTTPLVNPNIEQSNPHTATYRPAVASDLLQTKPSSANIATSITRLDWVGRNHGSSADWFKRTTNFLYADGHVETKRLEETLAPFQWGDKFFSLTR